jgi:hypothetical protein
LETNLVLCIDTWGIIFDGAALFLICTSLVSQQREAQVVDENSRSPLIAITAIDRLPTDQAVKRHGWHQSKKGLCQ